MVEGWWNGWSVGLFPEFDAAIAGNPRPCDMHLEVAGVWSLGALLLDLSADVLCATTRCA